MSDLLVEDDLFLFELLFWLAHDVCMLSCFVEICFALDTRVRFMIAPFQFNEITFHGTNGKQM